METEAETATRQTGEQCELVEGRGDKQVTSVLERMRNYQNTQSELIEVLERRKVNNPCPYLEVETYTWEVLPPEYRSADLADDIVRELEWVKQILAP